MADKYLKLGTSGHPEQEEFTTTSAGAGDAGKGVALNESGEIDETMMPAGVGATSFSVTASEDLSAGNVINLWNDGGTLKMRKADATDDSKPAHGFVTGAVSSGASGTFYYGGVITGLSSLTIGDEYFLHTTAGAITDTPPSGDGNIVQSVGVAKSATELMFMKGIRITVAA